MKYKKIILGLALLVLGVGLQSCTGSMKMATKSQYQTEVTPEMKTTFSQAEGFYKAQKYSQALIEYEKYIQAYPYNALTDESHYKMAKIYFLKKEYNQAIASFNVIIVKSPDPEYVGKARHYAGFAAFNQGDYTKAYNFLKAVKPLTMPVKLRVQFFSLALSLGEKNSEYQGFSDYALLKLYDTYEEMQTQLRDLEGQQVVGFDEVKSRLAVWTQTPLKSEEVPDWMKRYPSGPAKVHVDYKLALTYHTHKPQHKNTHSFLNSFLKRYPRSSYFASVKNWLDASGVDYTLPEEKSFKVGLILPSGAGQVYSDAVLKGIHCAAGFEGACQESSLVSFVSADAGPDAESLRAAFESLKNQEVHAIIAMVPTLALEAAALAGEVKLPTFLISPQEGLMKQSDYLFQIGLLPTEQIEALVSAATKAGHKRFAIYYPDIKYGQVMSTAFESAVLKRSGKIMAKVAYNKGSADPFESAEKLQKAIQSASGAKSIDALFVPDSFLQLENLITGLSFYQLKGFSMLGTNAWNDAKLTPQLELNYPGSLFIDLYDATEKQELSAQFKSRFETSYQSPPSVLNALGYDSMMMLREVVSASEPSQIASKLKQNFHYQGVTGLKGFILMEKPIVETKVIEVKNWIKK